MVKRIYLHFNKQLQKLVKPKKPLHFSGFFMQRYEPKQRVITLFSTLQPNKTVKN